MAIKIISSKQILKYNNNLDAYFHIHIKKYENEYNRFLSKGSNSKYSFSKIAKISKTYKIKKGQLYIVSSFKEFLKFEIAKQDIKKNSQTMPVKVITILDNRITASYLQWYFEQKPIKQYLSFFAKGGLFLFIPDKIINNLKIPIPKVNYRDFTTIATDTIRPNNLFRQLLKIYYDEYQFNIKAERYITAGILAGAIAEILLKELLIEAGIKTDYHNKAGLGEMIKIVDLKGLDKIYEFNLEPFSEIRKVRNRNRLVHPSNAANYLKRNQSLVTLEEVKRLNQIIKDFGI